MKPKAERLAWLMAYFGAKDAMRQPSEPAERLDVLNAEFVDAYIDATQAPCDVMFYGAHKCPQLGRDLSELSKDGKLSRARTGLHGMAGMGFPRWVWSYHLTEESK